MVKGIERFREYFRDFTDQYVLIADCGGVNKGIWSEVLELYPGWRVSKPGKIFRDTSVLSI